MSKIKKAISTALIIVFLISFGTVAVFSSENASSIQVILNGNNMSFDVPPSTINNRIMLPFRAIFEALGATVNWNGITKTVIGRKTGNGVITTIILTQYSNQAVVTKQYANNKTDTEKIMLDAAATPINGRTMVPLRIIAEILDAAVDWDNNTKTVYISSSDNSTEIIPAYSNNDLYKAVKSGLQNCKENIYITGSSTLHFDDTTVSAIVTKVANENPELDYLKSYLIGNGTISFVYNFPLEKVKEMRSEAEVKAAEIVKAVINPGMTDLQKELVLHDYVVNHASYDYNNFIKNSVPNEDFTAYGILINGAGVCQGYAAAMNILLHDVGIESIGVVGGMKDSPGQTDHAWNIVKINGKYYQLDTTWDDPVYFVNKVRKEILTHDYFNLTDKQMSKDHTWNTSQYPKCV